MAANIDSNLANWSTTDSSNQPDGTDSADIDAELRRLQAVVRKYTRNKGADIASASTTDLSTATGDYVDITGTTTITSLGTVSVGMRFILQFDNTLTLTHSSALVLPGAANITTAAGDHAIFESLGSGNWVCVAYTRASGLPAKAGANSDITSLSGLTTALSVAQGGTGKTSATAKSLLVGNGTSALAEIAPGTLNQVLMSDGTDWLAKTILSYNPGAANLSDGNLNFYDSAGALALKVIWGYQASVADGGTVNFHSAFTNYCFGVWPVLIYNNNNGANAYNVTKNSFAVYHGSGASLNVSYIAIGK